VGAPSYEDLSFWGGGHRGGAVVRTRSRRALRDERRGGVGDLIGRSRVAGEIQFYWQQVRLSLIPLNPRLLVPSVMLGISSSVKEPRF